MTQYMARSKGTTSDVFSAPLAAAQDFYAKYPRARTVTVNTVVHRGNYAMTIYGRGAKHWLNLTKGRALDPATYEGGQAP